MLKKITTTNFKSIKNESVDFDKFNVIVGPNNHGKTNLLDAIDFLYNGSKEPFEKLKCKTGDGDIVVEIVFDEIEEFIPLASRTHQSVIRESLDNGNLTLRRSYIRGADKPTNIEIVASSGDATNRSGIDNAIRTLLPRFEYVRVALTLDDAVKIQKTNYLGTMLYDIFTKVTPEAEEAYKRPLNNLDDYFNNPDRREGALSQLNRIEELIHGNLARKFPDALSIRLGVQLPHFDELIKGFKVHINDGIESEASEKGEGMQRGLLVSIIEAYSQYLREINDETEDDEERSQTDITRIELKRKIPLLFVIDEAELHLHPSAQKELKRAFFTLTESGDQVILTTHSHILAKEIPENSHIFRAQKINQETSITKLDDTDLFDLIYELLGTDPSDLLFPQNIGVVEGSSDNIFLSRCLALLQTDNDDKKEIVFHYCSGDSRAYAASVGIDEMLKTVAYIPMYRNKLCVLLDSDVDDEVINEIRNFLDDTENNRVVKLTNPGIEYYYPIGILCEICEIEEQDIEEKIGIFCSEANSGNGRGVLGTYEGTKPELATLVCSKLDDINLVDDEIKDWLTTIKENSY